MNTCLFLWKSTTPCLLNGFTNCACLQLSGCKKCPQSSRSLQWMWNFQKQLKPLGNFVLVLQSPRIWNSWLWYVHRQTVFLQNIDIWVNFKATVKIFVWFWAQKFWTLESPRGMFLQGGPWKCFAGPSRAWTRHYNRIRQLSKRGFDQTRLRRIKTPPAEGE